MKNQTFGDIEWTGREWKGTVALPYFRMAGERIHLTKTEREELSPGGRIPTRIETGEVRRSPSSVQAAAWEEILERKPSIWDGVINALIEEYRIQRRNRVRYWKTLHGNRLLSKSLPAHVDAGVMKQLILPLEFTIQQPDKQDGIVDCYITMLATWWSESLNVYIRNGRVVEVTALGSFMYRKLPWIECVPFGKLRRRPSSGEPWIGEVRLNAFQPFAAVAVDRTLWDSSYTRSGEATSDLPWGVSRGAATLWIFGDTDGAPTDGQSRAFDEFVKHGSSVAPEIMGAIFGYYQRNRNAFRKLRHGAAADLLFPVLKEQEDLRDWIELVDINVFGEDGNSPIAIGLIFQGTWTGEDGVGIRWRNGQIEEIGTRNVAVPDK